MKRKQANILDMLKKKKITVEAEQIDEDSNGLKLSPYLMNSNDLTEMSQYSVSTMAKVYFRDHSNINEVLDRYLERQNLKNVNKDNYLSTLIRHVISDYRVRRDYPFNMFSFESDYHECIAKYLLKHYDINSTEDLQEANLFMVQNNLSHCQISLSINNKFREEEQEYIKRKKDKVGYQNLKPFLQMGTDHALRQYKLKHNLLKKYYMDDISLEEMCQISTIERLTRKDMIKKNIPESSFDACLKVVFASFKSNRGLTITHEGFYIYPDYLLIINNLTPAQELAVTKRMDHFYDCTNAKDLLALYKKNIPLNNDSLDPVVNRKERRRLFYFKFIRLVDKKEPPFNNLLWIKKESDIPECTTDENQPECDAGQSNSNIWKKKPVTEKTSTTTQPLQKSATAIVENSNNGENIVIKHRLAGNPKDYLSAQIFGSKYFEIITFLMKEKEIVEELKKDIVQNPICANMWDRNFKVILWNCIHYNLDEKNEYFFSLLTECPCSNRELLNEMLKKVNIDVMQSIGEPIATSTQTMDISFVEELSPILDNQQNRPFQKSCVNSDDIVDINNKSPECEIPKHIKQEIYSEQFINDSDVQIVSLNATDVVSISDDENTMGDINPIVPENNGIDVYQQNLNIESQVNHDSNDVNASMEAEYGLISHRIAVQNVTNRKQRNQLYKPRGMIYDSETTSLNNNGNSKTAAYNIISQESNNFSIFFSTQLMFDYACHSTIQTLLTYAKTPQSSVSSIYPYDYRSCFVFEAQRVMYVKNHKFEMLIDLPLFSIYDVHIRNTFIKEVLNLNNLEWNILIYNLNLLESYEFVRKKYEHNRSKKEEEFENVVKKHLDLYFSSLINFKKFHYQPTEDLSHIECINSNLSINSKNVSKSIKASILQKIKFLKK